MKPCFEISKSLMSISLLSTVLSVALLGCNKSGAPQSVPTAPVPTVTDASIPAPPLLNPTPSPAPVPSLPPQMLATGDCGELSSEPVPGNNNYGSSVSNIFGRAIIEIRTDGYFELTVFVIADNQTGPRSIVTGRVRDFFSIGRWSKTSDSELKLISDNNSLLGTLVLPDLVVGHPAFLKLDSTIFSEYRLPAFINLTISETGSCPKTN